MKWNIKRIISFSDDKKWENDITILGSMMMMEISIYWIGLLEKNDRFRWTAGSKNPRLSLNHLFCENFLMICLNRGKKFSYEIFEK